MVAVQLRLVATPETRDELVRRVHEDLYQPTRAEPGCISYRFYQDTENPDAFCFVEQWRDFDAFYGHLASDHVGGFLEILGPLLSEEPHALFQEVSETRGLEAIEEARGG